MRVFRTHRQQHKPAVPKKLLNMNITHVNEKKQDNSWNWIKLVPHGDNTLDLCRIFSRSRYKRDFNGITKLHDQRRLNQDSSVLHHEHYKAKEINDRDRVELKIHKNMIKVKVHSAIQGIDSHRGGIRGVVSGFSRQSRKNMIELMNKQRDGIPKTFITLTYADEYLWNEDKRRIASPAQWKNDIEKLRKRIERKYPDMKGLWRLELKNRLSGENKGLIAPHFHLLLWDVLESDIETWIQSAWYEIVDTKLDKHYKHGTHTSTVKSERHAMFYVSKYIAKMEDSFLDMYQVGRRWGRFGKFDTTSSIEVNMSEREFVQFRRLLRAWLKSKGSEYAKKLCKGRLSLGFVVFGIGDTLKIDGTLLEMPLAIKMLIHGTELLE